MKVYITGPMTGFHDYNREGFAMAAKKLAAMGYKVVNPHDLPEPEGLTGKAADDWRLYLARDAHTIISEDFDMMVSLPGATTSRGSRLEMDLARSLGIPVIDLPFVLEGMLTEEPAYKKDTENGTR